MEQLFAFGTAIWLGVLSSVSPCPLATNLAAISFLTKELGRPSRVLGIGIAYTLGRAFAYTTLGVILMAALASAPLVSHGLQTWGNRILGPLLILVGMVLLELLPLPSFGFRGMSGDPDSWRSKYRGAGGGFVLGVLFALSFCPVSAALFFGSLLALAAKSHSSVAVPFLFGVGTALPVALFAGLLAAGVNRAAAMFDRLAAVERWARKVTGVLFLGIGIYTCLIYLWGWNG